MFLRTRRAEVVMLALSAVVALCIASGSAQERAPLPAKILSAQTIYLSNESGDLKAFDAFYSELRKWGRFKVVPSKDEADLVAVLTTTESSGAVVGTATGVSSGSVTTATGSTVSIPRTFLHLRLVDRASSESLWTDSVEKWLASGHAPSKLVGNLKARTPKAK